MTTCIIQNLSGQLELTTDSIADCTGWVLLNPEQAASIVQPIDFALMGITPENILFSLTWGAGFVLTLWALGFAVNAALRVINKA